MARFKKKPAHPKQKNKGEPKWFSRRSVITIFIVAIIFAGSTFAVEFQRILGGPKALSAPGFIIDGDQLHQLLAYSPSTLPQTYFDNERSVVLKPGAISSYTVPNGWKAQAGNHYTSFTTKSCGVHCYSFQSDISAGNLKKNPKPHYALYDDEYWGRTPGSEQHNPCGSMGTFVAAAHARGLSVIVAPDQDLAQPRIITHYQGGESENWQTYLRLGLGTCAAISGADWYHIMSQPFEAHWCGDIVGVCDSSESDFVNFVTQAALQAKAVNPNIKISDGLSTNPKYFGYFRGAGTFAGVMYRDYADVRPITDAVWMNIVGPKTSADPTTLYFLSLLSQHAPTVRRSSVLFLRPVGVLQNKQPSAKSAAKLNVGTPNSNELFVSRETLPKHSTLPDGTGEFQFWTDGNANDAARIGVNFGYCRDVDCNQRTAVTQTSFWIHGNQQGATAPGGAFTTKADTALPDTGGPYRLYVRVFTETPANFNLLYGSTTAPTNLATPVLLNL